MTPRSAGVLRAAQVRMFAYIYGKRQTFLEYLLMSFLLKSRPAHPTPIQCPSGLWPGRHRFTAKGPLGAVLASLVMACSATAWAQSPAAGASLTLEAPLMGGALGRASEASNLGGGFASGIGSAGPLDPRSALQNLQSNRTGNLNPQELTKPGAPPTTATESAPLQTTQFQRFVQGSTGVPIKLYGYNLFEANRYPAVADVPVPANYVLGPGDEIDLKIWGTLDVSLRLAVDRNGQVTVPKVGPITVAGTRSDQLEPLLKAQIGRVFSHFELSATLGRLRTIQVFVVGQARKPGAYTVSSLSTVVSTLFESGGPSATGSLREVQLVRAGQRVTTLDLYKFIHAGDTSTDARLLPGDVIVIPPAGPRVALVGALDNPAVYELSSPEESLGQLLTYSGGQQVLSATHKVLVERIQSTDARTPRLVEERALNAAGLQSTVRDGDVVTLLSLSPAFANAVTLRGTVAQPLRYAFKPGMRVSDLIPEPEALIEADYYTRKNILVQREVRANTTGLASNTTELGPRAVNDVRNLLDEINWDYAAIERLDSKSVKTQLIPFNLSQAIKNKHPEHNVVLQPGDVVTIFSVKDLPIPMEKRNQFVRVAGEVRIPGVYPIQPGDTLSDLVQRAGGFTPNAYPYGTVFTRESTRAQQQENLDKAIRRLEIEVNSMSASALQNITDIEKGNSLQALMAGQRALVSRLASLKASGRVALEMDPVQPALPRIRLEDGDQITVPNQPSFVGVFGAVFSETTFIHRPGSSVGDYLDKAGLTREADVDHLMVIRADGTVESTPKRLTLLGNSLTSKKLNPGDSVFVPEVLDRRSAYTQFITGAKDWTQLFYQFGLGAAAVKTLRN